MSTPLIIPPRGGRGGTWRTWGKGAGRSFAVTSSRVTVEPVLSGEWISHGIAGGIPFVAEGATESGAVAEAVTAVFECHAARQMRKIAAQLSKSQEADPCST